MLGCLVILDGEVQTGWVDFNNHMSAPCFAVAFGDSNDAALERLGFGSEWREASGCALFVAEARNLFRRELHVGDRYRIQTRLAEADDKRLRLVHHMRCVDGVVAADAEILFLHVATDGPKAIPFDIASRARLAALKPTTAPLEP